MLWEKGPEQLAPLCCVPPGEYGLNTSKGEECWDLPSLAYWFLRGCIKQPLFILLLSVWGKYGLRESAEGGATAHSIGFPGEGLPTAGQRLY